MNPNELTEADLDQAAELLGLDAGDRPERCDGCRHWSRLEAGDLLDDEDLEDEAGLIVLGECRRFPPQVAFSELTRARAQLGRAGRRVPRLPLSVVSRAGVSPVTDSAHWCGEHAAVQAPVPPSPARAASDRDAAEPAVPVAS